MCPGHFFGPHLVEQHMNASLRCLPRSLAPGKAPAYDNKFVHINIYFNSSVLVIKSNSETFSGTPNRSVLKVDKK
jgi:hypothetical protein